MAVLEWEMTSRSGLAVTALLLGVGSIAWTSPARADEDLCDHVDNDGDGYVDEDAPNHVYYADTDLDGYGDPAVHVIDCDLFPGHTDNAQDCDDGDPDQNPAGAEVCNYEDDDCDGEVDEDQRPLFYLDEDADGYGLANETTDAYCSLGDVAQAGESFSDVHGDCNDDDAQIHPAATEVCDGLDNDCDEQVDEDDCCDEDPTDNDGDGFSEADGDCDDDAWTVFPGGTEIPDGLDNDCDGEIDEGTPAEDADGDGYSVLQGDCDDTDDGVAPDLDEIEGDYKDNDCDGEIDEGDPTADLDGDGVSEADGDCAPKNPNIHPGAYEIPNDLMDNDCDGGVDEQVPVGCVSELGAIPVARPGLAVVLAFLGLMAHIRRNRHGRRGKR